MNYGYDAQGNRVRRDNDEESSGKESTHASAAQERSNGNHANPRPSGREQTFSSDSDTESGSAFSDSVELVIGETGNQPLDQPLVETANLSRTGKHRNETATFLQLEARPHGREQPLLIAAGPKAPLTKAEKETLRTQTLLSMIAKVPHRVRTVALAGTLHHGKTSLLNRLLGGKSYVQRRDEEERRISVKTHAITALVRGLQLCKTTNLVTFVDTPGHPDFVGEVAAGVRLADAALFCVDAFESLDGYGERLLRQIVLVERLPILLVITKVDRLILELKLPPLDAYRKLRMTVEAVNNTIASWGDDVARRSFVSPENGTVLFSSAKLGFLFSLETFALKYAAVYKEGALDFACLAQKLWGQITFEEGVFTKLKNYRQRPTFVTFVLEPLYKVVAHSVTGKGAVHLSPQLRKLPRSPMAAVQEAVRLFLGDPSGDGIDAILSVLPVARPRTETLCTRYNLLQDGLVFPLPSTPSHDHDNEEEEGALPGDQERKTGGGMGVSVVAIAPLTTMFTGTSEVSGSAGGRTRKQHRTAWVIRVLSGVLRGNPSTRPLQTASGAPSSSSSSPPSPAYVSVDELSNDANPFSEVRVLRLFVRMPGEGFVEVQAAYPGQVVYATTDDDDRETESASTHFVLIGGPAVARQLARDDEPASEEEDPVCTADVGERWLRMVRPWPFQYAGHKPVVHVSLELKDPAALPVFRRGLHLLRRTTPGLDIRTEESGEYTMTGFGELQLDTALHELRTSLCASVSVGLSQPFVSFRETVLDAEGVLAVAGTRGKGMVGCTSGVLPRALVSAVEEGQIDFFSQEQTQVLRLWRTMREDFGFDALDARNVIALGPDRAKGPSLLFDDTLAEERAANDKPPTAAQRNAMVAGFRDAMRSGPLVGETVCGVGVKLIFTELATDKPVRLNELRSNTRLAVRRSLFGARPRLLEPVLEGEILCPAECVEKLREIFQQRRGAVLGEVPVPATTLTRVKALVPALDSLGLETQIRMMTYGQAYPMLTFSQWDVVPGDPYDATVRVAPLEPAKGYQLARDFALKTRFRKGLSQELTADI